MKKLLTVLILVIVSAFLFVSCNAPGDSSDDLVSGRDGASLSYSDSGHSKESEQSGSQSEESSDSIVEGEPKDETDIGEGVYILQSNIILDINKETSLMIYSQYANYSDFLTGTPKFTWSEPFSCFDSEEGEFVQAAHDSVTYRLSEKNGGFYFRITGNGTTGEFEIYKYDPEIYKLPDSQYIYKTPTTVSAINSRICVKLTDDKTYIYYADTLTTNVEPRYVFDNSTMGFSSTGLFLNKTFQSGEKFLIKYTESTITITLQSDSAHGIVGYSATCRL